MSDKPVGISAIGMACPVGLSWEAACAAMRAGITRKDASVYRDNQGPDITASSLSEERIPREASCEARWLFYLARALAQVAGANGAGALSVTLLFLALPMAETGRPYPASFVADALSSRLNTPIRENRLHIVTGASPAGRLALQEARTALRAGTPCVVAAADSLVSARRMLPLSDQGRLLVDGNPDGIIPGEAAVALRLTQQGHPPLAFVRGIGTGAEPSTVHNTIPLRAEGLVAATRAALAEAKLALHEMDFRLADAAGESFFFKEQALLLTRVMRERKEELPLWLPAGPLGDTGTAASLCGLSWACAAWQRQYAPGPRAIVLSSCDGNARGALIIERAS